ncbi:MAG: LamG domain-containing protein [Candidatus Hydrogenedentes bacterium]|nr:LamG domain-containing protein [Candidatus Hydrogenedentota bacterium]
MMRYALVFVIGTGLVWSARAAEPIAHWPLVADGQDASPNARHAVNHGAVFDSPSPDGTRAARFDGRAAYLEVPSEHAPALGTGDFTISAWVCTEASLDDGLGDIVGMYDAAARRGLNFGILAATGVTNSQPNYRTVYAGIDNAQSEPQWTDCGRPGNAIFIFGMAVHEGQLYAATCEPGEKESGHVYRYDGGTQWIDCGSPDKSNAVASLAVYDGHLYAGTGWYDTTGSSLGASPNTTPGGKVYRYDGDTKWTFCGVLSNPETGEAATMGGMGVYKGKLYATTLKQPGFGLYRYEGGTSWTYCGNPGRRVLNPCTFNGKLYMVSYDQPGGPFTYDGTDWAYVGGTIDPPIYQDYSFTVYEGRLHVSTWPQAYVYKMDEKGVFTPRGRTAEELETMGMMAYNGKLYVGTLPSAQVFRLDGENTWTPFGQPLDTTDTKYRRAWSMAVYKGKLFCGVLPTGRVFSIEAGRNVTCDTALEPGWRNVSVVRKGGSLSLYIDGKLVSTSAPFDPAQYDLSNGQPFRIGFGAADYFNGWIKDVRVYNEAVVPDAKPALN